MTTPRIAIFDTFAAAQAAQKYRCRYVSRNEMFAAAQAAQKMLTTADTGWPAFAAAQAAQKCDLDRASVWV